MRSALSKYVSSLLIVSAVLLPLASFAQVKESATPTTFKPAAEVTVVQLSQVDAPRNRLPIAGGAAIEPVQDTNTDAASDYKAGTIFAALALMCAIAIRRHRSGRR